MNLCLLFYSYLR